MRSALVWHGLHLTAGLVLVEAEPLALNSVKALVWKSPQGVVSTVTLTPESFRFWAWAWPCEP